MNIDYSKFLSAKLYLIEQICLPEMLKGDEKMKQIHQICTASYKQIEKILNDKCTHKDK